MKQILNENFSLNELQTYLKNKDFHPELHNEYFYKLVEEVGELSKSIRKKQKWDKDNIKGTIEEELSDVLYYLACIANIQSINLSEAFIKKEKINLEKYKG